MGDARYIGTVPNPLKVSMNDNGLKVMKIGNPRCNLYQLFDPEYQLHSRNPC